MWKCKRLIKKSVKELELNPLILYPKILQYVECIIFPKWITGALNFKMVLREFMHELFKE